MLSKTLAVKGFAALSATSALGTGAVKIFSTDSLSEKVRKELIKKYGEVKNQKMLEKAGFRISIDNDAHFEAALKKRLFAQSKWTNEKAKIKKFCQIGLNSKFTGINDVYKLLATLCTRTISIKNKLEKDKKEQATYEKDRLSLRDRLSNANEEQLKRTFLRRIERKLSSKSLLKSCEWMKEKDVFSKTIDQYQLSDYMHFCLRDKPSTLSFWIGEYSDPKITPPDEETVAEEKELENETISVTSKIKDKLRSAGFVALNTELNSHEDDDYWKNNVLKSEGASNLLRKERTKKIEDFKKECKTLLEENYVSSSQDGNYKKAVKKCTRDEFEDKLIGLKYGVLKEHSASQLQSRWNAIVANTDLVNELKSEANKDFFGKLDLTGTSYSEDLAVKLVDLCFTYSNHHSFYESNVEQKWKNYVLFCAKDSNAKSRLYSSLNTKNYWTHDAVGA